ncbi:MAG: type II secretion system F family protein [Alphaproteobacteria bacterium]|nr:type II secretion system F family protein [Alphaproteobacteria bacterium]
MTPILLVVLVAISLGAVIFTFVPALTGDGRADKRKKALKGNYQSARESLQVDRQRDARRKTVAQALKAQSDALAKHKQRETLENLIFQAGMSTTKSAFIRYSVIFGVVVAIMCWLFEVPLLFAFVFGTAGGYLLPRWFVKQRRKRYRTRYLDELPNAVEVIVRGVKSGLPLNDSVRVVSREAKEPVRSEFARVLDQQSFGKSMAEAIQILYERVPTPEVNFFVVVITVQQQAGGNLSEALTNLSKVLRNRKKMKAKVKAMSSEAKASAMIIGSLPFIVAALVSVVRPGYLNTLIDTPIGNIWLGVAAVMMLTGIFVMNRMIQFEV